MPASAPFALLLAVVAGLSTVIGSIVAFFIRKPKPQHMSMILGFSAGVMVYVSFAELLHTALDKVGFLITNLGFFIGILFIAVLDILIPHQYKEEHMIDTYAPSNSKNGEGFFNRVQSTASIQSGGKRRRRLQGRPYQGRLIHAGILTAIGIAIHNLPEGLAVFSSAVTGDRSFGIMVAVAIAIHNIPEGISVSIPIAEATGSRWQAFFYSFVAGLAEPIGALIGYAIIFPFLTPTLVYSLLAFAAGVMVYISLDELLPTAHLYGKEHFVIIGVIGGMLVMALSIFLVR